MLGETAGRFGVPARRLLAVLMALVCAAAVLTFATGCRDSDALKEIVYDQTSDNIDYENPNKFYINDSASSEKSDQVPADEVNKDAQRTEVEQNIVVYDPSPNSPQYTAKQSVWDPNPEFKGPKASASVKFYESDDPSASEQNIKTKNPRNGSDQSSLVSGSDGQSGDTGSGGSGDSDDEGDKKSPKGSKPTDKKGPGGGSGGSTRVGEVDLTDPYQEPPKVSRIAAFGDLAVMVQMVGGDSALLAADKSLLGTKFKTVFKKDGAGKVVQGWSDGGSAKKMDVDAIVAAKKDKNEKVAILVYSEDYQKSLTEKGRKKLKKNNFTFVRMARLSTSRSITGDVSKIGEMLSESTVIGQAGKTADNADSYISLHNEVVKACLGNNGVGKLAGSKRYESYTNKKDEFDLNAKYTLLLDAYDTSVRFDDSTQPAPTMNGIALSKVGYADTPASYYIQVGGLINNAAERAGTAKEGLSPVWQFASPTLKKKAFSYSKSGTFNDCVVISGNSWERVLLTTNLNMSASSGAVPGSSFGSSTFPRLIAATQDIKTKVIENSKEAQGAYHPFSFTKDDAFSGYGVKTSKGAIMACIGVDGNKSNGVLADGFENKGDSSKNAIPDSSIEVSPHGLFSSWTDGGSLESFLEAAWVNDVVNIGHTGTVGWEAYVERLYKECYRYTDFSTSGSSSDMQTIKAGLKK